MDGEEMRFSERLQALIRDDENGYERTYYLDDNAEDILALVEDAP